MYYNFLLTDPNEHIGKIQLKKRRKLNIYTSQTHTELPTDKKTNKQTPVHSSLYLHKKNYKKLIINEVTCKKIVY